MWIAWTTELLLMHVLSLVKIDDDRLEALLRDIQTMRKYQS
jgi:hypothetical protein